MTRAAWKAPHSGRCSMCGQRGFLVRHHIVTENHVRQWGGDPWDLRNALDLGRRCRCHENHHAAVQRIPRSKLPDEAIDFAIELLGTERAALYIERFYDTTG